MPKINDDKKKMIEPKLAAPAKAKSPGGDLRQSGFAAASAALKPKPVTAEPKAAPPMPKLSTFASCTEPLGQAIAAAQSVRSGSGAISTLARSLEAIRAIVKSTVESAEYTQKGDLATRFDLSAAEKNRIGEKAATDLAEVEAILDTLNALVDLVASSPEAALTLDRAVADVGECRSDVDSLGRTFASEGFVLQGEKAPEAAPPPPPKAAPKPVAAKKAAAPALKKPTPKAPAAAAEPLSKALAHPG